MLYKGFSNLSFGGPFVSAEQNDFSNFVDDHLWNISVKLL